MCSSTMFFTPQAYTLDVADTLELSLVPKWNLGLDTYIADVLLK